MYNIHVYPVHKSCCDHAQENLFNEVIGHCRNIKIGMKLPRYAPEGKKKLQNG